MIRWRGTHAFDKIRLADDKRIAFGNDQDIYLTWDGTRMQVAQLTTDSEIRWGVDGAGIDQRWYGDTALAVMLWDQSADQLIFAGNASLNYQVDSAPSVYTPISVGRFVGSGAPGSGYVMTLTKSAALRVYAEDGGADLTTAALVRAILGRTLVSGNYTQSAEVFGVIGQFVVKQATINKNTGGVMGSWESNTTAPTVTGTADNNIHAGVVGRVGAVSGTTLSATGVMAGIAAMSNVTDGNLTITSGGIYAGIFVGKWLNTQNWDYGVYLKFCKVGVSADNVVLTPDSTRTRAALTVGTRATEKDITMAGAASQHLDPIQMNLNIIGVIPTSTSTVNGIFMQITHDTTAMTGYLRLKGCDWTITVGKHLQDVYVFQGEIDFTTAAVTVGGEAAVLGLVMNAGSYAITGNLRGLIISMQGAGTGLTAIGLEIRTTCGTAGAGALSEGIRIAGTPIPVVGIALGNQTNDNEGPQFAFFFPYNGGAGGGDIGPWVATNATGDAGKIKVKLGSATKYINLYNS